jgi:hypothetical protein
MELTVEHLAKQLYNDQGSDLTLDSEHYTEREGIER